MKWTDAQRAARAARLLVACADVATEAARLLGETKEYAHWSAECNLLASHLSEKARRVERDRARLSGVVDPAKLREALNLDASKRAAP